MNHVLCTQCARMVVAQPKVDFLGFPKFHCPECMQLARHPLSTTRLVVYWLIAILSVGWAISIVAAGGIPLFGILPALVVAAVVMDLSVRSRYRRAAAHRATV